MPVAVDVEGVAGGDPGLGDGLGQVGVVVRQGEAAGSGQGGLTSKRVVAVLACSCVAGGWPVGAVDEDLIAVGRGQGVALGVGVLIPGRCTSVADLWVAVRAHRPARPVLGGELVAAAVGCHVG